MPKEQSELFLQFKEEMPSNEKVTKAGLKAAMKGTPEDIKQSFSSIFERALRVAYEEYLLAEDKAGNKVIKEYLQTEPVRPYKELNDFFLAVSQSRKPRAGKAFENVIKELFKNLGYPFAEQAVINGKPDFLLPSKEYYEQNAMDCIVFTAKRTVRERWRQIVTEGTRAYGFFLATQDEKITTTQLKEMADNKIFLVVPASLNEGIKIYRDANNVITFEDFFEDHLDPAVARWKKRGVV
jgi:hypothetical protein